MRFKEVIVIETATAAIRPRAGHNPASDPGIHHLRQTRESTANRGLPREATRGLSTLRRIPDGFQARRVLDLGAQRET
jgi:hypothetical protein